MDQSKEQEQTIRLRVHKRELALTCAEDQIELFQSAALMLENIMHEIAKGGEREVMPMDQRALYAGIKLAADLIEARKNDDSMDLVVRRLEELDLRIDTYLEDQQNWFDRKNSIE